MYYQVPIEMNQQEDGLWRAEAPSLQGCWVDAPTLAHALAEMPQVIAMVLHLYLEKDWPIPAEVSSTETLPIRFSLPIAIDQSDFRRPSEVPKNG